MITLYGLHLLPSFLLSLPLLVAGASTLVLSLPYYGAAWPHHDNNWYFIGFAISSMGRNDRPEASVLQAKADSQVPLLL